jgi:uracil-DNA glycosylase
VALLIINAFKKMEKINPDIHSSWKTILSDQFDAPYFAELKNFLLAEKQKYLIFPPGKLIFNAFNKTPFEEVKVVILGQDPYHGPGQAHGLCFSVPSDVKPPPSLVNIFKEINAELGIPIPMHGNLDSWAGQGILLLNATLTVRANEAGSHQGKGWEKFTDSVIQAISFQKEGVVFLLWGKYAQAKEVLIDSGKHLVLKSAHPSPLSAYAGFMGCGHFLETNEYLRRIGKKEIDWRI